jgi:hypothetical protein
LIVWFCYWLTTKRQNVFFLLAKHIEDDKTFLSSARFLKNGFGGPSRRCAAVIYRARLTKRGNIGSIQAG